MKGPLLFICFQLFTLYSGAQAIYFCDNVSDDGYPVYSVTSFIISKNGGALKT
ncbi:MAG: hypothetical protein H0W62_11280 [Chitinophagales bacterium]|nr:hypothetical protein [Chitinophagales bacterium]